MKSNNNSVSYIKIKENTMNIRLKLMILGLLFGNSMFIQAAQQYNDQDNEEDDAEQIVWEYRDDVPDMQMQQDNEQIGEAEDDAVQNVQVVGEIDDGNLMSNTMDTEEDINTFENLFLLSPMTHPDSIYMHATYPRMSGDWQLGGYKDLFVCIIAQKIDGRAAYETIKDELAKDVCFGTRGQLIKMGEVLFKDGYLSGHFGRLIKLAQRRDRQDVANVLQSYAVDKDGNSLCCSRCDYIGRNKQFFDQHQEMMHFSNFRYAD